MKHKLENFANIEQTMLADFKRYLTANDQHPLILYMGAKKSIPNIMIFQQKYDTNQIAEAQCFDL